VVVGKNTVRCRRNIPVFEIAKKLLRITQPTERHKWTGANFFAGKKFGISVAKSPKTQKLGR
jgi:hypothetical protein